MTGMPSSDAFLTAGRIASESIARMIRTSAPLEIRLSTSVSCLVGEPCASAEMYFAPPASSAFLIAASSVFQRSSWKFDQETPTVRSFAEAAKDITLAEASKAAPIANLTATFIIFLHYRPGRGPQCPLEGRLKAVGSHSHRAIVRDDDTNPPSLA